MTPGIAEEPIQLLGKWIPLILLLIVIALAILMWLKYLERKEEVK